MSDGQPRQLLALTRISTQQLDLFVAGFSAWVGRTGANNATQIIWIQMSNRAATVCISPFYFESRHWQSNFSGPTLEANQPDATFERSMGIIYGVVVPIELFQV